MRFIFWLCQKSYWTWPFIVSVPIKKWWFFHSHASLPEGTWTWLSWWFSEISYCSISWRFRSIPMVRGNEGGMRIYDAGGQWWRWEAYDMIQWWDPMMTKMLDGNDGHTAMSEDNWEGFSLLDGKTTTVSNMATENRLPLDPDDPVVGHPHMEQKLFKGGITYEPIFSHSYIVVFASPMHWDIFEWCWRMFLPCRWRQIFPRWRTDSSFKRTLFLRERDGADVNVSYLSTWSWSVLILIWLVVWNIFYFSIYWG